MLNGQRVNEETPYWALTIMIWFIMIVFFFTQRVLDAVQRAASDCGSDDNAKEVDKKISHRATPPFGMD